MAKRILDPTNLDDNFFKERVSRTQAFLGEALAVQKLLKINYGNPLSG